ncbi:Fanconi anemia-associated protein of 24 kDa [Exaiptasia diaphana]|nr:Fanconi anemia-associated protein of 24 kDa [Exaiptasia diaphana]
MFDDTMGLADFLPSSEVAMAYLTESDLISSVDYKTKILKLSKVYQRVLVLAERTSMSEQYFPALQHFVVMERSLVLIPLTSTTEAAKCITQMVKLENKPLNNPYRIKRKPPSFDTSLLATVQNIPGLGEKKAMDLLKEFKSIEGISNGNFEKMSSVIGKSSAQQVKTFFQQSFHKDKKVS